MGKTSLPLSLKEMNENDTQGKNETKKVKVDFKNKGEFIGAPKFLIDRSF